MVTLDFVLATSVFSGKLCTAHVDSRFGLIRFGNLGAFCMAFSHWFVCCCLTGYFTNLVALPVVGVGASEDVDFGYPADLVTLPVVGVGLGMNGPRKLP